MVQAIGTWVLLKDPREKKTKLDLIVPSAYKESQAAQELETISHILEVVSVGDLVRDQNLKIAKTVMIDTRAQFTAINTVKDGEEEFVIVLQENQIVAVLS
jgi:hypothetical protein